MVYFVLYSSQILLWFQFVVWWWVPNIAIVSMIQVHLEEERQILEGRPVQMNMGSWPKTIKGFKRSVSLLIVRNKMQVQEVPHHTGEVTTHYSPNHVRQSPSLSFNYPAQTFPFPHSSNRPSSRDRRYSHSKNENETVSFNYPRSRSTHYTPLLKGDGVV